MRLGVGSDAPKVVKIENIEFLRIQSISLVKNKYTSRKTGFTHETMVILSSHMHWPHIQSLKGAKIWLGAGSEAPEGVKIGRY